MVGKRITQGDIVKMNPDPKKGHEQSGYRPFVCLSHDLVQKANIAIFAPISNTERRYPLYIDLYDSETTGKVLMDQLAAYDFNSRGYTYVERISEDMLDELLNAVENIFQKMP